MRGFMKKYIVGTLILCGNILSLQAMQLSRHFCTSQKVAQRHFFLQNFFGKKDTLELQKQLADLKIEMASFKEEQLRKERENHHLFAERFNACNDLYLAVENIRNNMQQGLSLDYTDFNRFANFEAKAKRCYGLKYNPINKPFNDGTTILGRALCLAMDKYMNNDKTSLYDYKKDFLDVYKTELNTGDAHTLVQHGARINDIDRKKLDELVRLGESAQALGTMRLSKIGYAKNMLDSFQHSLYE